MVEPFDSFSTLQITVEPDGIAVCTFNRPQVRNALSLQMVNDFRQFLAQVASTPSITALILTGAGGKAFISGADIAELSQRTPQDALNRINSSLFQELEQFPLPTIAAICGYALGGGCELALACDLRICGESAQMGQPEVKLGIIPAAGATYRLPRLIGLGRAKELIMTGRRVGAQEALQIGLVNQVVPDAEVLAAALTMARQILENGPMAVRLAKVALNQSYALDMASATQFESALQAILFNDEDKKQRMQAFLQQKKDHKP